jgi:hypothetical protein
VSVEAINAVRSHRFGSSSRKVLMLVLADYASADWSTYVGQARLAGETELGERTVRRLLAELERDGLLRRMRRNDKKGFRSSDRLVLIREAIVRLPASLAARAYRPPSVVLPATGVEGHGQPTGQALAGNPSVNQREPVGVRAQTGASYDAKAYAADLAQRIQTSLRP